MSTAATPAAGTGRPVDQVLQRFKALPNRTRLALMIAVPAAVAAMVGLMIWAQQPDYKVLFSGLSDRDGGAVVAALNQMQIPNRVGDGGASIQVPSDKVHEVRLRLAQQGLPKGGTVGFETMDNPKYGLTQFQEQLHFQRALEGELSRSIMSLSAVQTARVHLAVPKQTVFIREQQKPTASVVVTLHPGRTLDRQQLQGIVHLVASSVPDLAPKSVSVVDQHGALLTGSGVTEANGLDANQMAYLNQLEANYVKRITDILTPLVGGENIKAQVNIDVDFSQVEQTSETYKPNQNKDQQAIRSQQTSEQQQSGGSTAAGVPGSLTNQPPGGGTAPINPTAPGQPPTNPQAANASATTQTGPSSSRRDATINYEVDKTVSHAKLPTGTIRRLSAAIVVNHRLAGPSKDPRVQTKPGATEALSDDELKRITALAKEAIGFSDKRGDSINVVNAPFTKGQTPEETPMWQDPTMISLAGQLGKWLVVLLLGSLLVFGVLRPLLRQLNPPPSPLGIKPDEVDETDDDDDDAAAKVDINPSARRKEALDQARKLAKTEPKMVASVVRNWVGGEPA